MPNKFLNTLTLLLAIVIVDALASLLYFWAVLLSYALRFPHNTTTLPVAIRSAAINWQRPDLLTLSIIGLLSPLLMLLPLMPLFPFIKKSSIWSWIILGFIWLCCIFALGFFITRL